MSSIEDTFQTYVHSGIIRPVISPQPQACPPLLERYQFSRVLDDSYWVQNRWRFKSRQLDFSRFLVLKKGNLCRFLRRIYNQTTLSLGSTPVMPGTADTSHSTTDTQFLPDTALSSFSGSGISWFENGPLPNRYCDLLIFSLVSEWSSQETETLFDERALTGERSVNLFHPLITWTIYQQRHGDPYRRTQT